MEREVWWKECRWDTAASTVPNLTLQVAVATSQVRAPAGTSSSADRRRYLYAASTCGQDRQTIHWLPSVHEAGFKTAA